MGEIALGSIEATAVSEEWPSDKPKALRARRGRFSIA
jgi:hypothetical protein